MRYPEASALIRTSEQRPASRTEVVEKEPDDLPPGRLPRLTRLMALAIRFDIFWQPAPSATKPSLPNWATSRVPGDADYEPLASGTRHPGSHSRLAASYRRPGSHRRATHPPHRRRARVGQTTATLAGNYFAGLASLISHHFFERISRVP